jgi:hypothetical protein
MRDKGFEYAEPLPSAPGATETTREALRRRYLGPRRFDDGRIGYYQDVSTAPDTPIGSSASGRSKEYSAAFFGDVVATRTVTDDSGATLVKNTIGSGCLGLAQAELFGSPAAYLDFISQVNYVETRLSVSLSRLLADSAFSTLMSAWSSCMTKHGFSYDTIFGPGNADWDSPRPSAKEQVVASADLECRTSTHSTVDEVAKIEARIQAAMLERFPFTMDELKKAENRILALAAKG